MCFQRQDPISDWLQYLSMLLKTNLLYWMGKGILVLDSLLNLLADSKKETINSSVYCGHNMVNESDKGSYLVGFLKYLI